MSIDRISYIANIILFISSTGVKDEILDNILDGTFSVMLSWDSNVRVPRVWTEKYGTTQDGYDIGWHNRHASMGHSREEDSRRLRKGRIAPLHRIFETENLTFLVFPYNYPYLLIHYLCEHTGTEKVGTEDIQNHHEGERGFFLLLRAYELPQLKLHDLLVQCLLPFFDLKVADDMAITKKPPKRDFIF